MNRQIDEGLKSPNWPNGEGGAVLSGVVLEYWEEIGEALDPRVARRELRRGPVALLQES